MTRNLTADIEISAPAGKVWDILTDTQAYSKWNPFITKVEGRYELGKKVSLSFLIPSGRRMRADAVISSYEPEYELAWRGNLLTPFLMDVEHYFRLEPAKGNSTRLIQGENFSGVLTPLFMKILRHEVLTAYRLMNNSLKERAEAGRM